MEIVTTFLHGISVGLLLLTAAALARPGADAGVRVWGTAFAATVAGYVIWQDGPLLRALAPYGVAAWALSTTSSGFFLLFARALLLDRKGLDRAGLAVLAGFVILSTTGAIVRWPRSEVFWSAHQALEFGVYGYALWLAVGGWRDDLDENRRALRGPLVAVITVYGLMQGLFETLGLLDLRQSGYPFWEAVALAIVCAGVPLFILQTRWDRIVSPVVAAAPAAPAPVSPAPMGAPPESLNAADRLELGRLLELIDRDGAYRDEGLTIGVLADRISIPEHRLRRLINHGLGYRNYAAFLNDRRIAAAKSALGDPAQARTSVLTLALNLGYGSVGPFNRAFKDATGMTPTEFRARTLSPNSK